MICLVVFVGSSAGWEILDVGECKIGARKNESCKNCNIKAQVPNLKKDEGAKTKFCNWKAEPQN